VSTGQAAHGSLVPHSRQTPSDIDAAMREMYRRLAGVQRVAEAEEESRRAIPGAVMD
jgi:hypothetical protein